MNKWSNSQVWVISGGLMAHSYFRDPLPYFGERIGRSIFGQWVPWAHGGDNREESWRKHEKYRRLIHGKCMAKPLQYCKVISIQLKWINLFKKKIQEESVELGVWVGTSKDNPGHWVPLSLLLWLPILCMCREPDWIPASACWPIQPGVC